MTEPDSPPASAFEFSQLHADVIDRLKLDLLIVLVNRLGGKVDIPVPEVDGAGKYVFGMQLTVKEITGNKITDATVGGVFHFEVRKKQ